jgi:sec-independent protein translocase protein TatC
MSTAQAQASPLVIHLIELRNRLCYLLLAVLLVFLCLVGFANPIYTFVAAPLLALLPESSSMIATDVAAPFLTPFKLTFFVAFMVTLPFIIYQVLRFILPGLYKKEKAKIVPFMVFSVLLFYLGIVFAYFVVFPLVFGFFTSMAPDGVKVMTDISSYLGFVLKLFFAFGLVFEIPVLVILLIHSGAISPEILRKQRPYVIVVCFVVGMLLTPPDVISQLLLAVPMWLLYELGIVIGKRL